MLRWVDDITKLTLNNTNFRTVVYTAKHTQLTLMSLEPGEEIGWESHPHLNQFLRLRTRKSRVGSVAPGQGRRDPRGRRRLGVHRAHRRLATSSTPGGDRVKLYSLYSPPEHPDGTIHETKADADADG